jgi:hypothetical protein
MELSLHLHISITRFIWFILQRKIKAPSPSPLDEDDSRRELVESDQDEMVQASDSEMQVKLHDSITLPWTKYFLTCLTYVNLVKLIKASDHEVIRYI